MKTRLFSPLDIRNVRLKNRAVMAPMVFNCAGEDGSVTPVFEDFYAARARGGASRARSIVEAIGEGLDAALNIGRGVASRDTSEGKG